MTILPDDDPRKAEVEALGLVNHSYNLVCECLRDKPNLDVDKVIEMLQALG